MNESFIPSSQHPIIPSSSSPQHLPVPTPRRAEIAMSLGTMADVPFMDALQKRHGKGLGYFPTKQFEGYVATGGVLIARDAATGTRLGYCISRDRYLKRDELGVIYQLCVDQGEQRKLVGAALVREVFHRSAYGCRLYCCWCAQDLAANHFWESMGFIPIAFRAGSTGKRRVHIFWQRRVDRVSGFGYRVSGEDSSDASSRNPFCRAGAAGHPDTRTPTPYWYPCQTNSGAIREDRLVFPIPPGVHWRDIRPVEVRAVAVADRVSGVGCRGSDEEKEHKRLPSPTRAPRPETRNPTGISAVSGLQFGKPKPLRQSSGQAAKEEPAKEKPPRQRVAKPHVKIDPQLVAKARELRDRYLEQANEWPDALVSCGKYDVGRALAPVREAAVSRSLPPQPRLPLPAAA